MAEKDNNRVPRIGIFVGIGLVFGVVLGAAFDKVGIGAAFGLIVGAAFGMESTRTK